MGSPRCFSLFSCSFIFLQCFLLHSHFPILADSRSNTEFTGPIINVTKSLSFPNFNSLTNLRIYTDVSLLGSAKISSKIGTIQIPDESQAINLQQLAGRAIYSSPIRLLDPHTQSPASFETTFTFQFTNTSTADAAATDGGSGLTFIIVPDEFTVGRPGPWLGMLNDACDEDYKAVAIEFDTRQNPEFGDPNDNHVGINLGTIISTAIINVSDVGLSLKDGSVHRAWINYDGRRRFMDVRLGSETADYFSTKPIFSKPLDLSPFLNEYMFVGFSASTGNMTQIHNVISWNFTATSQAFLRVPSKEACESKIIIGNPETLKTPTGKPPSSFLIFVAVVILVIVTLINLYYGGKRRGDDDELNGVVLPEKKQRPRPPNKPRRFTISEISSATRCFSELNILGSGSRGVFYRGTLTNGCQVAVKRFSTQFLNKSGLNKRRVLKEIISISRLRHPNLVPIRGWCYDNREIIAVYDYLPNRSLNEWLFGIGVLPWTRRFKVIKDVAEALSFLHSKQLAHKNVKTSSVFLDVSFRAVLGDFGYVLSGSESKRFESVESQKSDVFGFGVFVLEVVAGRGRFESEVTEEEMDLLEFAWRMHEREERVRVVDRQMGKVVNLEQAIRVLEIGLLCSLKETKGRPSMEEVVRFLSMEVPVPELPLSRPVSLFPYNSTSDLCRGYSCPIFY